MFGSDIVIVSGLSQSISLAPGSPDEFFVTGSATLSAGTSIQFTGTPVKGKRVVFHYKAIINLGTGTLTIAGLLLNKEQASKESKITCIYDGSAWSVHLSLDASDLPSGATSTETTALTAAGLVRVIDPETEANYQTFTGSATLAGSVSITQGGTPKQGQEMWINYKATLTQGANTVTLFGQLLTADQALTGNILVYSKYNGAAWETTLLKSAIGQGDLWEPGSGTESCQRLNATTGCQATGDYSVADGKNTTASGDYSLAEGFATVASGDYSRASGHTNTASGYGSEASGNGNTASGDYSHVEGQNNSAVGDYSHAEGNSTQALGSVSHSEGSNTIARADSSSAKGVDSVSPYDGSTSWGSGKFSLLGDNQKVIANMKVITTDATPTVLVLPDSTGGVTLPTDSTASVHIHLVGVQVSGAAGTHGDSLTQDIELGVANVAGTSAVIPTAAVTLANYSVVAGNIIYKIPFKSATFTGTAVVTVSANMIVITVTGDVAKTIRWSATVELDWIGWRNFTV
jgi:hypothetical protein